MCFSKMERHATQQNHLGVDGWKHDSWLKDMWLPKSLDLKLLNYSKWGILVGEGEGQECFKLKAKIKEEWDTMCKAHIWYLSQVCFRSFVQACNDNSGKA